MVRVSSYPDHEARVYTLALLLISITTFVFLHAIFGVAISAESKNSNAPQTAAVSYSRANLMPSDTIEPPAVLKTLPQAPIEKSSLKLPRHVLLNVPFTSQAPGGVRGEPWRQACEETSVVMTMAWVEHETNISPKQAQAKILEIIAYEDQTFGYHGDMSVRETAKILTRFYHYPHIEKVRLETYDNIRAALAAGELIIAPIAGALLENPYFSFPPPHHMVVIIGYDDQAREFIVNDPGTRHGKNYRYTYEMLWNAIHDWTGSDATIQTGEKKVIVVHPES